MGRFENFGIGRACPLFVVDFKQLKPLTALSGTVYRLASSSDHTPVLFNMFEEWNEQEAQLPQRDSASATHVFLGSLTDRALH